MKAYHQGQLDFFCAIYAVINALKLTDSLELADARHILAESLREISARPLLWEAVLSNQTDYYWLLRWMFGRFGRQQRFAFRVGRLPEAPLSNKQRKMLQKKAAFGGRLPLETGTGGEQAIEARGLPAGSDELFDAMLDSFQEGGAQPATSGKKISRGLYGLTDEELRIWIDLSVPPESSLDDVKYDDLYQRDPAAPTSPLSFQRELKWSMAELWPLLQSWLPVRSLFGSFNVNANSGDEQKRCLILRFHRHLYSSHPPLISHWTTGQEFYRDTLQLFDCTADKHATHTLPLRETVLADLQLAPDRLLRLEPESVFFIEKV